MKKIMLMSAVVMLALAATASAQQISGDYIETRSADIYTGPCVANGEVNLVGDQAILAWRVSRGQWNGVALDGLSVVGVVKAGATLGDQYSDPYPAKSVLILDARASSEQQKALLGFAREMGGRLFENIIRVEVAPIKVEISHAGEHYSNALVRAGEIASIETRAITPKDHMCGNEETFYPPLVSTHHAMPAVAETDEFQGRGLGVVWTIHGKRSAFVGSFSR
ncbi:MAG: DUF1326 domain-containing protein [Acidobacteriota bacterium]